METYSVASAATRPALYHGEAAANCPLHIHGVVDDTSVVRSMCVRGMLEVAVVALVVGIIVWVFLWWIGVLRY